MANPSADRNVNILLRGIILTIIVHLADANCMYNTRMPLEQSTFKRQAAAIPFRTKGGKAEILLIRRKGRPWGIPKGSIDPGHTPRECALNEAEEEAGLHGELLEEPLGEFVYEKQLGEMLVRSEEHTSELQSQS